MRLAHFLDQSHPPGQLRSGQTPQYRIKSIEVMHRRSPGPEGMRNMLFLLVVDEAADVVSFHNFRIPAGR